MTSSSGYIGQISAYDSRQSAKSVASDLIGSSALTNTDPVITLTADEFKSSDNLDNKDAAGIITLTLPSPSAVDAHTTMFSCVDGKAFSLHASAGTAIVMGGREYTSITVPANYGSVQLTAQSGRWIAHVQPAVGVTA